VAAWSWCQVPQETQRWHLLSVAHAEQQPYSGSTTVPVPQHGQLVML
jgi:hypothetical protein